MMGSSILFAIKLRGKMDFEQIHVVEQGFGD